MEMKPFLYQPETLPAHFNIEAEELCQKCREIDFRIYLPKRWLLDLKPVPDNRTSYRQLQEDGSWSEIIPRSRLDVYVVEQKKVCRDIGCPRDILSRAQTCMLCAFTLQVLKIHKGTSIVHDGNTDSQLHCYLYQTSFCSVDIISEAPQSRIELFRMGIALAQPGRSIHTFLQPNPLRPAPNHLGLKKERTLPQMPQSIRLCYSARSSFTERPRPVFCDPVLLNLWTKHCSSQHIHCRSPSELFARSHFRLVNVGECCVESMKPQSKLPPYIALSYVWGVSSDRITLTKANRQELGERNSLAKVGQTIRDAMTVAKMLDVEYIWVDALCIVQDDPEDKKSQIPQMAHIYNKAFLTIIAAYGASADAGLPGVSIPRRLDVIADIGRIRAYGGNSACSIGGPPMLESVWSTRGWTFQERLLSNRCLIFTVEHVHWCCKSQEWFEDLQLECDGDQKLIWPFNAGDPSISDISADKFSISNYGRLVEHYTRLKLTKSEDILNAFAGVLTMIKGEKFEYAMPHSTFGHCMCWKRYQAQSFIRRRMIDEKLPSWSWAAWEGAISMNVNVKMASISPIVTYYKFDQTKELYCIYQSQGSTWGFSKEFPGGLSPQIPGASDLLNCGTLQPHEIGFLANTARVKVVNKEAFCYDHGFFSYTISPAEPYTSTDSPSTTKHLYDFHNNHPDRREYSPSERSQLQISMDLKDVGPGLYDIAAIAMEGANSTVIGLLLSLSSPRVNGTKVFRRESLAKMHLGVWAAAKPKMRVIVLE